MRATRFVVADDVPGQWWIKDPIDKRIDAYWVRRRTQMEKTMPPATVQVGYEPVRPVSWEPTPPWWQKYREGLDCPFCVGQWIAAAVVVVEAATAVHARRTGRRWARAAWTGVAAALTLNETAAHLGAALGDTAE
jgi:hypothetical protein